MTVDEDEAAAAAALLLLLTLLLLGGEEVEGADEGDFLPFVIDTVGGANSSLAYFGIVHD